MKATPTLTQKLFTTIAQFRKERRFTQMVLAQRANIDRTTLFRIEKGQVIPSVMVALKLAKVLDVSVDDLFSLEEKKVVTKQEKFENYLKNLVKKKDNEHTK